MKITTGDGVRSSATAVLPCRRHQRGALGINVFPATSGGGELRVPLRDEATTTTTLGRPPPTVDGSGRLRRRRPPRAEQSTGSLRLPPRASALLPSPAVSV
nr:hypothetical protein Iba_chr01bCG6330 [Ipomoea batatas]